MRILMINKYLCQKGGAETYLFELKNAFEAQGHEVSFFGMEDENRLVSNALNLYTSPMDFHKDGFLKKCVYPFKVLYSKEARKKLGLLLEDFCPDLIQLNNFHYQLTPSILLEIDAYRKRTGKTLKIVYTAHDYQLICPNHMCYQPFELKTCHQCLEGSFMNCAKNRCIHNSLMRSILGSFEALYWNHRKVYDLIDEIVCCSQFMKNMLDLNPSFQGKTRVLRNFMIGSTERKEVQKEVDYSSRPYVLYFGRYSFEKGIHTLLQAAKKLPEIDFVFAGAGPLKSSLAGISNCKDLGFLQKEELKKLISGAEFTIYPPIYYENCPFSVIESISQFTPVIGANIGGMGELIRHGENGLLFEVGNEDDLVNQIYALWSDEALLAKLKKGCEETKFLTAQEYSTRLL